MRADRRDPSTGVAARSAEENDRDFDDAGRPRPPIRRPFLSGAPLTGMRIRPIARVPRVSRSTLGDVARRLAASTTGTSRVWALTLVLTAVALAVATLVLPAAAPAVAPIEFPWWVLAAVFYLAEAEVIHLHIGRSAHSFSMSEIPLVYGIFFFRPADFSRRA